MIKSMTGFGRADMLFDDYKINVEVKTVNNRYLDINTKVYKQYSFLEETARECISKALSRGKADMFIQIEPVGSDDVAVVLNEGLAVEYKNAMDKLAEIVDVKSDISVSAFLRLPDVFNVEKKRKR